MSDSRPGFKEHFWSKDDGSPGTIDGLILTMDGFIKKKENPIQQAKEKGQDLTTEIDSITKKIAAMVQPKLGNKAEDFAKYCSEHYLKKVSTLSDSEREKHKVFVAESRKKLDEDTNMMVDGFIYKREQLWGQKKRAKKRSPVVPTGETRDVEPLKQVISLMFQAKAIMEKMASAEPSWKENKLKVVVNAKKRKVKSAVAPTYSLDGVNRGK